MNIQIPCIAYSSPFTVILICSRILSDPGSVPILTVLKFRYNIGPVLFPVPQKFCLNIFQYVEENKLLSFTTIKKIVAVNFCFEFQQLRKK